MLDEEVYDVMEIMVMVMMMCMLDGKVYDAVEMMVMIMVMMICVCRHAHVGW